MGDQGECQSHITTARARSERQARAGFFRRAFNRMMPLVAGGVIVLNTAAAGAFELSGFGRVETNHVERGSEYATTWNREGGLKLNTDPSKPHYFETRLSYFNSGKRAKLSSPNRIVTEQMVLQQSLSVMRAGDTLSLAPMSFRMTSITPSGSDYNAHFDITDTGTGEVSALDVCVGDSARFPWKDKLYIIETEGDNLLAVPQTVLVRAFRAQENSTDEDISLYPSILDEGVEGSFSFGTGKGNAYWLLGAYARAFRRYSSLWLETGHGSVDSPIAARQMILPGAMITASYKNMKGSFKGDRERQAGSVEIGLKRLTISLEAARESIRSGGISWTDQSAKGLLDINLLKGKDGFIDIVVGGGAARSRISASGTYTDRFNAISANRETDIRWNPILFGAKVGKGALKVSVEGAMSGRNRRGLFSAGYTFR